MSRPPARAAKKERTIYKQTVLHQKHALKSDLRFLSQTRGHLATLTETPTIQQVNESTDMDNKKRLN